MALLLMVPVSTDCTMPSSRATALSASLAPGMARPSFSRRLRRVVKAPASASMNLGRCSSPVTMPLMASVSKMISESARPMAGASFTRGRPVTCLNASA